MARFIAGKTRKLGGQFVGRSITIKARPHMISVQEHRSASRKPLNGRVVISSGQMETKATDLSDTGMCIYAPSKLEVRQSYGVTFEIMVRGTARTISLTAEVVFCSYTRTGKFKVGMRFLHMDTRSNSWMTEYVQS